MLKVLSCGIIGILERILFKEDDCFKAMEQWASKHDNERSIMIQKISELSRKVGEREGHIQGLAMMLSEPQALFFLTDEQKAKLLGRAASPVMAFQCLLWSWSIPQTQ